jgi:hypothetical protein
MRVMVLFLILASSPATTQRTRRASLPTPLQRARRVETQEAAVTLEVTTTAAETTAKDSTWAKF